MLSNTIRKSVNTNTCTNEKITKKRDQFATSVTAKMFFDDNDHTVRSNARSFASILYLFYMQKSHISSGF